MVASPPAPDEITIVEVAPRDGLQSDPTLLDTSDKVELIGRAVRAGVRRIETVSFVNPTRVPQMADASEVMAALHADGDTRALGASYIGLVLNRRGLDRALETGVDEINVVVVCSDTFAMKNQGQDSRGLLDTAVEICGAAREEGLPTSITMAASFGCPYEGEVSLDRLAWVLEQVAAAGPDEVALADSIGVAAPTDVAERVALAREVIGVGPTAPTLRCHFHRGSPLHAPPDGIPLGHRPRRARVERRLVGTGVGARRARLSLESGQLPPSGELISRSRQPAPR